VKFPGPTRQQRRSRCSTATSAPPQLTDILRESRDDRVGPEKDIAARRGLRCYTVLLNPTLSPMTVVGPMGNGSGLAMSSLANAIRSFHTFLSKSSNT
jgi:hypothetical protein